MSANKTSRATSLLVVSANGARVQEGGLLLDKKFVEGMRLYAQNWPGRTACLLPEDPQDQPFADVFDPAQLPFEVHLRPQSRPVMIEDLAGHDVVLCSGDNHHYLPLARLCRDSGKSLFFIIENIPETRRQIVMLEGGRSALRKTKAMLSIAYHELRRKRAFAIARGLQANGYPAAERYRVVNTNTLLYLDNRMDASLLVTAEEMDFRRRHLISGGPLRLIHSGRLEPLKGSQDLIPIARQLRDRGVDFILDIFGSGSLEREIRAGISTHGLEGHVRLHGVADFATELVPYACKNGDIFLSCHRQSDPSCSYLENMGCGLAIAGYANKMWAGLQKQSQSGWTAPLGNVAEMARILEQASRDRENVWRSCQAAAAFSANHNFEKEFLRRLDQMRA
ncbi:glycosyltransferase [Paracoccus sp. (in: a-proteobacteria)]|uniref:glycosyltransferase n=1 Tax=Paracoccus sp. TaxID=267 RepID=UPI0035B2635C